MQIKNYGMLSALLAVLIVVAGLLVFLRVSEGERVVVENVVVKSESRPIEKLLELSGKETFIVSPAFFEKHSINPYMANSMNLFLVVLTGNDKNAVQLVRVFSPEKKLLYCATNFGNELTQENISAEECLAFISASAQDTVIFIEFPDSVFQQPEVRISGNSITIYSTKFSDLGKTVFVAARIMFENAEEILGKTNALVEEIA